MRRLAPILAVLTVAAIHPGTASAQEVGQTLSITGCLAAEEDDDGTEFVLENLASEDVGAAEIELLAGEGVDLSAHVGHTVETTGIVIVDDDEGDVNDGGDDGELGEDAEDGDDGDIHVRVTALQHVAASCSTD